MHPRVALAVVALVLSLGGCAQPAAETPPPQEGSVPPLFEGAATYIVEERAPADMVAAPGHQDRYEATVRLLGPLPWQDETGGAREVLGLSWPHQTIEWQEDRSYAWTLREYVSAFDPADGRWYGLRATDGRFQQWGGPAVVGPSLILPDLPVLLAAADARDGPNGSHPVTVGRVEGRTSTASFVASDLPPPPGLDCTMMRLEVTVTPRLAVDTPLRAPSVCVDGDSDAPLWYSFDGAGGYHLSGTRTQGRIDVPAFHGERAPLRLAPRTPWERVDVGAGLVAAWVPPSASPDDMAAHLALLTSLAATAGTLVAMAGESELALRGAAVGGDAAFVETTAGWVGACPEGQWDLVQYAGKATYVVEACVYEGQDGRETIAVHDGLPPTFPSPSPVGPPGDLVPSGVWESSLGAMLPARVGQHHSGGFGWAGPCESCYGGTAAGWSLTGPCTDDGIDRAAVDAVSGTIARWEHDPAWACRSHADLLPPLSGKGPGPWAAQRAWPAAMMGSAWSPGLA